ncbi:MAG: hypothetical protein ABI337_04105 [Nitrososphaera sp.]|jgi:hypothetical protein
MNEDTLPIFFCKCKKPKKHKLTFDGGPTGQYQLECCSDCYTKEDKKHLIREEIIS